MTTNDTTATTKRPDPCSLQCASDRHNGTYSSTLGYGLCKHGKA